MQTFIPKIPAFRVVRLWLLPAGCLLTILAQAQTTGVVSTVPLPPKTVWRVQASSVAGDEYDAGFATDGKLDTRWSSVADDVQWLQIDLGSCSMISGAILHWEEASGRAYEIQTAVRTSQWTTVYATEYGGGNSEEIYFSPVAARYVRVACSKRATAWGYSLWEIDLQEASSAPLAGNASQPDVWRPNGEWDKAWLDAGGQSQSIILDLRHHTPLNGVRVGWGENAPVQAHLAISADLKTWNEIGEVRNGVGAFDALPDACMNARYVRVTMAAPLPRVRLAVREITLLRPTREATPLMRYHRAAARAQAGLYPDTMYRRQVYWTVSGLPGDTQESLIDENGTIEPMARGSTVMPYIRVDGRVLTSADAVQVTQELEESFLPMPSVTWHLPDLSLSVESLFHGSATDSVNIACYTITNGTGREMIGDFLLAIRPIQVNPAWQHGGLSPIRTMECLTNAWGVTVRVNGREQYETITPPDAFGVCGFDGGDIIEFIRLGVLPPTAVLTNNGDYLSGALSYRLDIPPGGQRKILLAMPMHETMEGLNHYLHRNTPEPLDPVASFEGLREQRRREWLARIGRVNVELPDRDVVNLLFTQVGCILVNSDGPALNPGSRNYKRVWIRDGALICGALLRMGQNEAARDFIDWYAARIPADGLVPPILNNDGTPYKGIGSNNEYDGQGAYIFAVMEYYRFTRDRAFLQRHYDTMLRVMKCLERLRNRTLRPDYFADDPVRARFVGLLPPSISHEGYATPVHSYWDNLFALKGWKDGRAAALELGKRDVAEWAAAQYAALRASVQASIERTISEKGINYIPGCAERGDPDPNSTSVVFYPCEEVELLPALLLEATYEQYYEGIVARSKPGWEGVYTPYEARNLTALVQLGAKPRAFALLQQFMVGRRPRAWNHLAEVVVSNYRTGTYIGDMPHTWVGADLVTGIRNLLLYESGDRLVLLSGIPESWVLQDSGVRLENMPTYFGAVNLFASELDGKLRVEMRGKINAPKGIVLHWPFTGKPKSVNVNGAPWLDWDANVCRLPGNFQGNLIAEMPGNR
ncbi:MAG: discoidin domain-containing protein [Kiritimatiellia bacterium]